MKIAYIMFDQMTIADFTGFYEVVAWMLVLGEKSNLAWDICSIKEEITDDRGMTIKIPHVYPDLSGYDVVFFPGGMSTRKLIHDEKFISWIRTSKDVKYKVSVCTGSLLMGAAGFLMDKRATTNPSAYELLEPYCKEVVNERLVREGDVFTAGAVGTAMEMGLFFVESLTNLDFVKRVQEIIDYPYYQSGI